MHPLKATLKLDLIWECQGSVFYIRMTPIMFFYTLSLLSKAGRYAYLYWFHLKGLFKGCMLLLSFSSFVEETPRPQSTESPCALMSHWHEPKERINKSDIAISLSINFSLLLCKATPHSALHIPAGKGMRSCHWVLLVCHPSG